MAVLGGTCWFSGVSRLNVIVEAFLRWAETAKSSDRASAANALGRAYLQSDMKPQERRASVMAMTYLLDDPSPRVRLALAEALCEAAEAPREIMMSLADDQTEIACTVIARSPVLTDADLVELIAKGTATKRALVASRPSVSRMVSAALCEVGEREEMVTLLDNAGAAFSRFSLTRIAERMGTDTEIRNLLLDREDLPADARHVLMHRVSEALAGLDLVQAAIGARRMERVTREANEAGTVAIAGSVDTADIPALVEHLRLAGRLTPAFLMHALCAGKVDFMAGTLVNLSGLDDRRVRAILSGGRMHAVRALYEAAGLTRDISAVFVEATLMLRKLAKVANGSRLDNVTAQLLKAFQKPAASNAVVADLMDLVEKLHIAEQRQSARSYASTAGMAA